MMRETFAAGAANNPCTFQETLRIREAAPVVASISSPADRRPNVDKLRLAFERFQQAWRWLERKRSQQLSSRRLRVAETISLGEKRSVSIVQVDGSQFLIGCSSASVQLLAVLDKQDGGGDAKFERSL